MSLFLYSSFFPSSPANQVDLGDPDLEQPAATVAAAAITARGGSLSGEVVSMVRSMLSGLAADQIEELQACFPPSDAMFAPLFGEEEDDAAELEQLPEAFHHLTSAMVSERVDVGINVGVVVSLTLL